MTGELNSAGTSPPTSDLPSSEPTPQRSRWKVFWQRSHAPLVILVIGFTVGYFFVTFLRYMEFYGTNWDLGINMQVLWSTTHGRVLYDAGDFETRGTWSILSLHTVWIAIPLSYVYAVAPGAATLLAIQAVVVASSAIPLYLIGKKAGLPEVWRIAGIAVLLLTFTVISAIMYDFHWEALLPAEFAWTYYLWNERRYVLAFVPALLGVLTLEVFPFLLLGLVLFFGCTSLRHLVSKPPPFLQQVHRNLRGAWPLVGLTLFAILSYAVLRFVEHDIVSRWLGAPAISVNAQVTVSLDQLFQLTATPGTIPVSLMYWFLLFAACGFLPFLFRQSLLLLSLPWFWASVFITPRFSEAFGNQYAFVAMATLSVAFVEALAVFYWSAHEENATVPLPVKWMAAVVPFCLVAWFFSTQLLAATPEAETLLEWVALVVLGAFVWIGVSRRFARPVPSGKTPDTNTQTNAAATGLKSPKPGGPSGRNRSRRRARGVSLTPFQRRTIPVLVGVLVVVTVSNLVMSPLNPANFDASPFPGYKFTLSESPDYQYIGRVVAQIPPNAVVVASDTLFPFVADDVNAYSLAWASPTVISYLPFNSTHLPPYVLLSANDWIPVPTFLKNSVYNTSLYGIVSMIYSVAYPGAIYLFATGYRGAMTLFQATPFSKDILLCPSDLALGPSGSQVGAPGTPCGSEIVSTPATNLTGSGHTVWYGPYITLLSGLYNVTMTLEGGVYPGMPSGANILYLNGNGFGATTTWYSLNLNANTLQPDHWTNFTIQLNLTAPVSGAEFRGYLDYGNTIKPPKASGFVILSSIQISWCGSAT